MAQIRHPRHDDGPVNQGERRLLQYLELRLPEDYIIIPNLNLAVTGPNHVMKYWEYDCIVVAPHAVYHLENKDWGVSLEGDDAAWFRGGQEVANPHKTAGLKSRILGTTLKNQHPDWRFGQVITAITLSHPNQSKFGIDPHCECFNQTFTLGDDLIEFLTSPERIGREPEKIKEWQMLIADQLVGTSAERIKAKRKEIFDYTILEKLQETEEFTEFLCEPKLIKTAHYRIREFPLDVMGKSPAELQQLQLKVQNAKMAQEKIGTSPYIVHTDCRLNSEGTYYYEINRYQDESSLRAKLRQKTFKQTDKINIILDVAKALKAAHAQDVYHRDIRPENVYIYEGGKAMLANFRMAWFMEHSDLQFSVFNTVDDKSPYTPPEFIEGDVCTGSDIFSLGVIFYELMVGDVPFDSVLTFQVGMGGVLPGEKLPSTVNADLPTWMDEVVRNTIVANLENRWQTADELIDFITKSVEEEVKTQKSKQSTKTTTTTSGEKVYYLKDMKPGMNVTSSMTLYDMLGKGGFGRVFKVWHNMYSKYMAIKIFERDSSVENAISELKALENLKHPNIVEFIYADKSNQGLYYTLMELLEGDNLQSYTRNSSQRLPIDEIYRMAEQILDALIFLQGQNPPVYHRDIKPSNIMWHKRQLYKLIDFNIASSTINDKSFAGTLPYMAPDLVVAGNKIDWDKSADTFSLGITIYELLAHAYPWPGSKNLPNVNIDPTDIRSYNDKLSDEMAGFVMKAIKTNREQRFRNAQEMKDALLAIGANGMLKDTSVFVVEHNDGTSEDPVDYINSLYSQSHHGNSGTRAGNKKRSFDDLTYSETKLDKKLIKDIEALKYKLIIITGNAGDGKTAFIHRIESRGQGKRAFDTNNGSEFYINGVRFETNYDGSQDEDEKANDEVLGQFFQLFAGKESYTDVREGRVIAINEGRLVDFLSKRPEFKKLQDNIEDYFHNEGHTELLPGLMIINLNLRSVTAKDGDTPSLLAQQIKKLTRSELWAKCEGCPIADRCFIKYNVDTFQDSSAGDEVINRLEWLIRTIAYKRELHITMRDLRSMIAWMLTRDYSCDEVKQLVEYIRSEKLDEYYWQYYYFNLTSAGAIPAKYFPLPTLESNDRLVKILRETDVAGVSLPAFDRDLYYSTKVDDDYIVFSDRKRSLLNEFNEINQIIPAYEIKDADKRFSITMRHKNFMRHQYFEGASGITKFDFRARLPYRYVAEFHKQLGEENSEELAKTMQNLAAAISASEGCTNEQLTKGYMLLASSNAGDPISKSYRRFSLDEFELFVNHTPHLTDYIEYESDSMTFRHKTDHFIKLTISLDLFEMLQYISSGFSPSVNDLRGRFIELQIFKNLLEAKTYSEILVTKNNRKFATIGLDELKRIVIKPLNTNA